MEMKDSGNMTSKVNVEIICPLYNASHYIDRLNETLIKQKHVNVSKIHYILTKSSDDTEEKLYRMAHKVGEDADIKTEDGGMIRIMPEVVYEVIKPEQFSHSLTREKAAFESDADIVVFITQDIKIRNAKWLYELIKPIANGEAAAAYSRQLCDNATIEKYTRERNYPENDKVVSKSDIGKLGLRTFFFSDAAGAIDREVFVKLNGYDGKNLPISEDMYFAHKLIMADYRIKYCAKSEVYHSHKFSFMQLFERYRLTGKFFKQNAYLDEYGTNESGKDMAVYIVKRIFEDKNFKALAGFVPNMAARFIGMQVGKRF